MNRSTGPEPAVTRPAHWPSPEELALVADLADLRSPAPEGVAFGVLVRIGLADTWAELPSPLGVIGVAWNGRGLSWIDLAGDPAAFQDRFAECVGRPLVRAARVPDRKAKAVAARLRGDRRAQVALDLRGHTPFEVAVWLKALEIRRGEVRPYGWIAAEIGRPKAVRAVGTALSHNPVPLVVPCHRAHRQPFRSLASATRAGFRPCRSCRPGSGASLAA